VASGNLAYVVDPVMRRRGYGTTMIVALLTQPDLAHIELFAAGVEPENLGSVGCLRAAGFQALNAEPDWEGIVYYIKRRRTSGPVVAQLR
jgi:RimJ/RimL family protein N-acetyltransferase